jgi:molybdate transport repressor ModE-like protein
MQARFNLWIENGNSVVLSNWRVGLLRAIEQAGSVMQGAKAFRVSERTARKKISEMEAGLGFELFEAHTVENGRKGVRLTRRGRKLVRQFDKFTFGVDKYIAKRFQSAFRG